MLKTETAMLKTKVNIIRKKTAFKELIIILKGSFEIKIIVNNAAVDIKSVTKFFTANNELTKNNMLNNFALGSNLCITESVG